MGLSSVNILVSWLLLELTKDTMLESAVNVSKSKLVSTLVDDHPWSTRSLGAHATSVLLGLVY